MPQTNCQPMTKMPLSFVLGVGVLGLGSIFCVEVLGDGILALAFCPEIQRCCFMSNIEQF